MSSLTQDNSLMQWFRNDAAERENSEKVVQEVLQTKTFTYAPVIVVEPPFEDEHVRLSKTVWMVVVPLHPAGARLEQLGGYVHPLPVVGPAIRAFTYFRSTVPILICRSSKPVLFTPEGLRDTVLRRGTPEARRNISMYTAHIQAKDSEQFAAKKGDFVVRTKGRDAVWKLFSHQDQEEYLFYERTLELVDDKPGTRVGMDLARSGRFSASKPNVANIPRTAAPIRRTKPYP